MDTYRITFTRGGHVATATANRETYATVTAAFLSLGFTIHSTRLIGA